MEYFPLDPMTCLDVTLSSVEEDLALDEALLIEADEGRTGPVLRFWEPRVYAVVLGASRRLAEDVREEMCRADGVAIFRRSSGGGTVVVGPGTLNVTVILPETAAPGLEAIDTAQQFVLERAAESIRRCGRPVAVLGRGDLTIDGRKCAGSAQRRLKNWFMVHFSILYRFSIGRITRYLNAPLRQPDYRAGRAHEDFLTNLGLSRQALVETLGQSAFPCSSRSMTRDLPWDVLHSLLSEKYANPGWIRRF